MRKQALLVLFVLVLVPLHASASTQPTPAAELLACVSDSDQASATTGTDFDFDAQPRQLVPLSSCGPNFCTQAQRTACAQSCKHHPFVGLECCEDTCTSFCNCGSVPTGC